MKPVTNGWILLAFIIVITALGLIFGLSSTDSTPSVGSKWVAVGNDDSGSFDKNIYTSTDGSCWTEQIGPFGANGNGSGVAYGLGTDGEGLWIAVGYDTSGSVDKNIYISKDGSCWTEINSSFGDGFGAGAAYGLDNNEKGLWVAVGNDDSGGSSDENILYSSDGSYWEGISGPFGTGYGSGVAYGLSTNKEGLWVAVGNGVSVNNDKNIYISTDGSCWEGISGPFGTGNGNGVAYGRGTDGEGLWVVVGNDVNANNDKNIYISKDGSCWNNGISGLFGTGYGNGVTYGLGADGEGLWIAVGYDTSGSFDKNIYISKDGSCWTEITSPFNDGVGRGVAYGLGTDGEGLWVVVGDDGGGGGNKNIYTSRDGSCWTEQIGPFSTGFGSGVAADHLLYGMAPGFYQ